jgi:hypothetical protein
MVSACVSFWVYASIELSVDVCSVPVTSLLFADETALAIEKTSVVATIPIPAPLK